MHATLINYRRVLFAKDKEVQMEVDQRNKRITEEYIYIYLSCLQKMKGWGIEQRLRELPVNNQSNLRTIPWAGTSP